jgi:ABC-type Na+ efflux pump permease subunit
MLVLLRDIVLQEKANKTFELILDPPSSHQRAFVAKLLSVVASIAMISRFYQLAPVAIDGLLVLLRRSLLS